MLLPDGYREDLAYIHDRGYGALAADAARRTLDELTAAGLRTGTIVDLGCGSGVLAAVMNAAGYHVVGIDLSEAMLALARARVPGAEFRLGSFVSADLPSSVAVTAVGEVVNYSFDTANDASARAALFRRVSEALVPGGVFLFDAAGLDRMGAREPYRAHAAGPDWTVEVVAAAEPGSRLLTRRITSCRKIGCLDRRDDEVHQLELLDPDHILQSLRSAGFEARTIPRYHSVGLPAGVVTFLARRVRDA